MSTSRTTGSMFVPPTLEIILHGYNKPTLGPFKGLAVYTSKNKINSYNRLKLKYSFDASDYVRICTPKEGN